MFAFRKDTLLFDTKDSPEQWLYKDGIMAKAFPVDQSSDILSEFTIKGDLSIVSESFNKGKSASPFKNTGLMVNRTVFTTRTVPDYKGRSSHLEISLFQRLRFRMSSSSIMRT